MIGRLAASEVEAAAARIAPWIRRTPSIRVEGPGDRPIVLKLEGQQRSGSFKIRGALNKLLLLGDEAASGVVTASGGNHGLGVARAGSLLGLPVTVFVPRTAPRVKVEGIEAAGGAVHPVRGGYPAAAAEAREYAERAGLPFIHAYDDPAIIAGQGTAVREMLADDPDIGTVTIAVGGAGLAAGAVLAAGGRRVVGVEPVGAATLHAALRAGEPVTLAAIESIAADSLGAGQVGRWNLAICQAGLDRVELIEDQAMLDAQRWLWGHLRLVVELGAAIGLAALDAGRLDADPGPVGVLLCGANANLQRFG